jgi:SAM-dependent methyltransferase
VTTLPPNVVVWSRLSEDHATYDLTDRDAQHALVSAETRHFWFLSRNRFIERRLRMRSVRPPARVLELGCGGGVVLAHLARAGYGVTGIDGHLERVLVAAERAPAARLIVHDLDRGLDPLAGEQFDVVALFDVLEHLDAPRAALEAALPHVRPGGWLVGTVPALRSLWSEVDVRSGHRRRYQRLELRALLETLPDVAEVEVVPFHRALVPLLWAQRRFAPGPAALERGLAVPSAPVNAGMLALLLAEHRLGWILGPVPGASLWFAVRRAEPPADR